jgi:hypothetical protein
MASEKSRADIAISLDFEGSGCYFGAVDQVSPTFSAVAIEGTLPDTNDSRS